jgi:hypothetical protein
VTFNGTLLTDGVPAYARFARDRAELMHARCWNHTRRTFLKTETLEPDAVAEVLELIGRLYEVERHIRERELDGARTSNSLLDNRPHGNNVAE